MKTKWFGFLAVLILAGAFSIASSQAVEKKKKDIGVERRIAPEEIRAAPDKDEEMDRSSERRDREDIGPHETDRDSPAVSPESGCRLARADAVRTEITFEDFYHEDFFGLCRRSKGELWLLTDASRDRDTRSAGSTGFHYLDLDNNNRLDELVRTQVIEIEHPDPNLCLEDITKFEYRLYDEYCAGHPRIVFDKIQATWCEQGASGGNFTAGRGNKCYHVYWDGEASITVERNGGSKARVFRFACPWSESGTCED